MHCRNCGKELLGRPGLCMNCGARPMAGNSFCSACGSPTNPLAEVCVKCGARLARHAAPGETGRSGKLTAIGVLNIIAGSMSLVAALAFAIIGAVASAFEFWVGAGWWVLALMLLIAGIMGIIGGAYSLRGRYWGLVLASCIVLLLFTFFTYVPPAIAIATIILTAMSRKDFV